MRALPRILRERPNARVAILGGDETSYGRPPADGLTFRKRLLKELEGQLDMSRVFFLGKLPYKQYLALLQASRAHVYLTYPFVLGWSMLEAMSAGCLVIGSRTAPVTEVLQHGQNGLLVDFFDIDGLATTVCDALARPEHYQHLREAARRTVVQGYDLQTVCLPKQLALLQAVARGELPPRSPAHAAATAVQAG